MSWEFTATTPDELAMAHRSYPRCAKRTVAEELLQMTLLLESLGLTGLVEYPLRARHTGEYSVPDFHLESGRQRIAVEMAKVTTTNLEHARALQMQIPDPPLHFDATDLCETEALARKLKSGHDTWYMYLAGRLTPDCRAWLSRWNAQERVPDSVKALLVAALNSIIDGPPIEGEPALTDAFPRPEVIRVEGFPRLEAPRDRKGWLEEAFWEELATPINPTLMVGPFLRQNDPRMARNEVLGTGFLVHPLGLGSPTLEEEDRIWVERFCSEVRDKTAKLTGDVFCHGDEDWLVLWDRLGTDEQQLSRRAETVFERLAPFWGPGWFSRVFVQAEYFEWQLMFTENSKPRPLCPPR